MTSHSAAGGSPAGSGASGSAPAPSGGGRSGGRRSGGGGRNLPAAIGVAVVLGAIIIGSLFVVKTAFLGVVLLAILLAIWELANALATGKIRLPLVPVCVGAMAMLAGAYYGGAEVLSVALAFTVIGTMVWRLAEGSDGFVRDATAGVFVTAYVPLLAGFAVLMLAEDDGDWRVLTFLLVTVASDVGGYITGYRLGKHPMAPSISPKKSWEGFVGSLLTCALVGWLTVTYLLEGEVWVGPVLGVVVAIAATLGDLGESLIKRDLGIKDMGNLLPGHGGIMDRLDSLLVVAPVCWLLLHLLVDAA
jgi:phosphatidate cytidylyltransferase